MVSGVPGAWRGHARHPAVAGGLAVVIVVVAAQVLPLPPPLVAGLVVLGLVFGGVVWLLT